MKPRAPRLQGLCESFQGLLAQRATAWDGATGKLLDSIRDLAKTSKDARLPQIRSELQALRQDLDQFGRTAQDDFIEKVQREAEELKGAFREARLAPVLSGLLEGGPASLGVYCERLLDHCMDAVGAARGFVVLYAADSTEAGIVAARQFSAQTLAIEDYRPSRTLLLDALSASRTLLLDDATKHQAYAQQPSVREFQIRSVLVVPLIHANRAIGAIYLEDQTRLAAFDGEDARLVERAAQFAVFVLGHARLLAGALPGRGSIFLDESKAPTQIVGSAPPLRPVLDVVLRAAPSNATVLILGESGTGKELVARALHERSRRKSAPFVPINCAAIPDGLLESELFGVEKGAFTTAVESRPGRVEAADGGTLFLDEIGDMALPLQRKLLRFLQNQSFERVGGRKTLRVDVRVVAATSKDLPSRMKAERFEEALYYRLNVISVTLPPLRDRREDIPALLEHFLESLCKAERRPRLQVAAEVLDWLSAYPFPGNVRELENLARRWVVLVTDDVVRLGDLPAEIFQAPAQRLSLARNPAEYALGPPPKDLAELRERRKRANEMFEDLELALLDQALKHAGENQTKAAQLVGLHRVSFLRRVAQLERRRAARQSARAGVSTTSAAVPPGSSHA